MVQSLVLKIVLSVLASQLDSIIAAVVEKAAPFLAQALGLPVERVADWFRGWLKALIDPAQPQAFGAAGDDATESFAGFDDVAEAFAARAASE